MNILIRTDINGPHGMGHAVRMRALAQTLAARGASVSFVTRTPELQTFVVPYPCKETLDYDDCPDRTSGILIVDTKSTTWEEEDDWAHSPGYLWAIREEGVKVVRIDTPDAEYDTADLVIGPCNHWSPKTVSTLRAAFGERYLYGWDYVMLAPEVTQQQPIPYEQRMSGPIVFCAGGSNEDALKQMWAWTRDLDLPPQAHFIFGAAMEGGWEPDPGRQMKTHFYPGTAYQERLRQAALIVGMFGATCYEAIWYQTPMLMFAHTEENKQGANLLKHAATQAFVCDLGMLDEWDQKRFCEVVGLLYHATIRKVTEGKKWIDGRGTQRVAEAIMRL